MEQRTQIGVECPQCHGRHFMEMEVDRALLNSSAHKEILYELEAWLASRCPDHLGAIANLNKN